MATATTVVPADVRDWLATPAPFNADKHGTLAKFSVSNSVVERQEPEHYPYDCVVYTRDPLAVGQVWQTTVLKTTGVWNTGLVSVLPVMPEGMHWQ